MPFLFFRILLSHKVRANPFLPKTAASCRSCHPFLLGPIQFVSRVINSQCTFCKNIANFFMSFFRSKMKMMSKLLMIFCTLLLLVVLSNAAGICFGGGYPKCCENGKNSCGPLCASCSRVGDFLMNMRMFMGSMGTPGVFRIINPDPHAHSNLQTNVHPTGFEG